MKNVVLVSNASIGAVGVLGMVWYSLQSPLWFLLAYFVLVGFVGAVGVAAILGRRDFVCCAAKAVSVVSLIVLAAMVLAAFAVSLGSGAAALPFLAVVAGVNVLTLSYLGGSR